MARVTHMGLPTARHSEVSQPASYLYASEGPNHSPGNNTGTQESWVCGPESVRNFCSEAHAYSTWQANNSSLSRPPIVGLFRQVRIVGPLKAAFDFLL